MDHKYCDYFDVDEDYFPQINDSSIAAASPDFWTRTYPHQTFIDMLSSLERVLSRQERRSLWIEGAYGTGKSQCAYALMKILNVEENDLRDYWNRYEPLRKKTDLLEKLIGHKEKGILTAYRYASGGIKSPRDLFLSIQDSVKSALEERGMYVGENTLKDSVIAWIDKPANKRWLDELLQSDYSTLFSQSTADEILIELRKGGEVKRLMDNIFHLADKEGVTALNIDADRLLEWLKDVIDVNDTKIVFIWDEFSDYFRNNRESLSEFQKIAELVNLKAFYFVVVTHESGQLFTTADATWTKVRDRFIQVTIALPDNIAFNLIGHAFNVKQVAKDSGSWDMIAEDLNGRVSASRSVVMKAARITDAHVMKEIMPLHPMAALILKNIAAAFKSNQRSMFDFIKSSNTDHVKAFQWYIENTGPFDDHPLLTVDMLWNFFYENGRNNLTHDIRLILDTFQQQQNLRDDEKAVLKAILIMQAIDQRLGGAIELFKATEQNISYVFEGISAGLDVACKNIAKGLKDKGILVTNPISGGKYAYSAAVLAGDQSKIDNYKKELRTMSTTAKLVSEGVLSTVLTLSPALRLRFESEPNTGKIIPVTSGDFSRTINNLQNKSSGWNFHAIIAFAKDEIEATSFRKTIKSVVLDRQYENIVIIDALSTPLGSEAFEQYLDYSAMAMYYNGNNNATSRENSEKAKNVLTHEWKNRIYNGPFIVYTYNKPEGEKVANAQGVGSILQSLVINRFPLLLDFAKNLSENLFKLTSAAAVAKCGITQCTSGVVAGVEKSIFPTVWNVENYWMQQDKASLPITIIKTDIDKFIEAAFTRDGQISIGEIYDYLEAKYGFAPCNLTAFIVGFLLKEYGGEPYRYSDQTGGHDVMVTDKLKEMLGNYIGKNPKPTYIVKMTSDEMAFYSLSERAWGITPNSCASASQSIIAISNKMRSLGLPIWCLSEVDSKGVYNVIEQFIELVQKEGYEAHKKVIEIGRIATVRPATADNLAELITYENCQKGMKELLKNFDCGELHSLTIEIGAQDVLLSDIRALFSVKHACLWDKETGEDEIRKLLTIYGVTKESNALLSTSSHTLHDSFKDWRDRLNFIGISYEALKSKYSSLTKVLDLLYKVYKQLDILPDQLRILHKELISNYSDLHNLLTNDRVVFAELYELYLSELSDSDILEVKSKLPMGMFGLSRTDSNIQVKSIVEEYKKSQLRSQMYSIWRSKTETRSPLEWSRIHKIPIMSCVSEHEFDMAKNAFDVLNRNLAADTEIRNTIEFLETTSVFEILGCEEKRNLAFINTIIGEYYPLLPNINKVRESLDTLAVEVFNWYGNPSVAKKIRQLAEAEYYSGGSDLAASKLDAMDDKAVKHYLKQLIHDNMAIGIEIITRGN